MRKETLLKLAAETGYNVTTNYNNVTLQKDDIIVKKQGFQKAYNYLYQVKRRN